MVGFESSFIFILTVWIQLSGS